MIDAYFLKPPHLVDLTTIDDKDLQQYARAGLLQYIQKHIFDGDILPSLKAAISWMHDVERLGSKDATFVQTLVYYVASTGQIHDLAQFKQIINSELPETGGKMMGTVFEALREEGREEARLQLAKRMLKNSKLSPNEISQHTDLPIATLRELQETN